MRYNDTPAWFTLSFNCGTGFVYCDFLLVRTRPDERFRLPVVWSYN